MAETDRFVFLYLALLILLLPFPWVVAALIAAGFHEMCHMAVLYLCGGTLRGFRAGVRGITLDVSGLGYRDELLCAAAGPLGSLFLLSLYRFVPRIALCAGVQGLYNLLPLYPYDGGRILNCLLQMFMPRKAERLQVALEGIVFVLLTATGAMTLMHWGVDALPVALAAVLPVLRKIPCKQAKIRVQ